MKNLVILGLMASLAACSSVSVKAGSSLTLASPTKRLNTATAELFLSRTFGEGELNLGLRHISNVEAPDRFGGVNGVFVEMRQTLHRF